MITRTFKLCLNAGTGSAPFINVSQTDKDEVWLFELYTETGERYIPSSGAIIGIKSDGHGIANTGTVDSEGRVVITETEQMTAAAGRSIFELSIDGLTHGTANFIVNVEKKPIDGAIMSDSDLSLISQAVDAAATIEDLIEGHDPDEVIADAVDAWLDAHPEATTTVEDGAITSAKLNDSVKTGVFEDMTVGTSLAVMNDEGQTDNLAYKFRQTGGDAVRELDEIVGGTIAWNQLVTPTKYEAGTYYNVDVTVNGDTVVLNGTPSNTNIRFTSWSNTIVAGHVYLSLSNPNTYVAWQPTLVTGSLPNITAGTCLFKITTSVNNTAGYIICSTSRTFSNESFKPVIFDLTQMFGSTVADAIYAMEQSSAGSGVAYFRSLFPNDYYAYNSGELVSVEGLSAHETVGFNQWDEEWENGRFNLTTGGKSSGNGLASKNKINVFPNTTYYANCGADYGSTLLLLYYDAGDNFISYEVKYSLKTSFTTPSNARYVNFNLQTSSAVTTYNNDICINISSSENGTYKPYQKHTYPLDSTLTLRGVPKWSNGLYFDGDIYRHDGSVQRRYGVVDLGTLNWELSSTYYRAPVSGAKVGFPNAIASDRTMVYPNRTAMTNDSQFAPYNDSNNYITALKSDYADAAAFKSAMSGVYLVYELATPTSETADPYQQYQICDGKGTEEYISETVTPVGHNTFYPVDIVAKVNKLPSDFSTLIAPTEEGFKATRNYTVNDLLIVNNVLYKVTANIANGGTITVNTNVQQTTLSALIKALS